MKTILGIDYGLKKIGLALATDGWPEPIGVEENRVGVLAKISRLCFQKQVDEVVIGLPEGKLVSEVKHFAKKLQNLISLPVVFHPETLTTKHAIAKMIEAGKKKKVRQKKKDAFAAALILQSFLRKNV